MKLEAVCALIGASAKRPDLVQATRDALTAQRSPPDHVLEQAPDDAGAGVAEALQTSATWIWLLDGVTVPEPGALSALGRGLDRLAGLPEPLVLAGRVLDAKGALHPDAAPRHEIFEKQITVDACERRLVHLRAAPSGSLLVHRAAFARFAAPRTDLPASWAAFEFTARVLRSVGDPGYLVPASVAIRAVSALPSGRGGGVLRARARLLAGPAWTPRERLWEGFLVAEGALRAVRGPARRA